MAEPHPPAADDGVHVQLSHSPLDVRALTDLVRRNDAGAVVTFIGNPRPPAARPSPRQP